MRRFLMCVLAMLLAFAPLALADTVESELTLTVGETAYLTTANGYVISNASESVSGVVQIMLAGDAYQVVAVAAGETVITIDGELNLSPRTYVFSITVKAKAPVLIKDFSISPDVKNNLLPENPYDNNLAITDVALNVRDAQGNKIGLIESGEVFGVRPEIVNGRRALVTYNGDYASVVAHSVIAFRNIQSIGRVSAAEANLRYGPGTAYGIRAVLAKDTPVSILCESGNYYLVITDEQFTGYIGKSVVAILGEEADEPAADEGEENPDDVFTPRMGYYLVTGTAPGAYQWVPGYSEPDVNSELCRDSSEKSNKYGHGLKVYILENGEWLRVCSFPEDEASCYVQTKYITFKGWPKEKTPNS